MKNLSARLGKRLDTIEQRDKKNHGVMQVPTFATLDEWAELAAPMQAELKRHVKSDEDGPPAYTKKQRLALIQNLKCKNWD